MTPLSPRAADLVLSFQRDSSLAGRLFGYRIDPAVLVALEELGEQLLAPLLLRHVIDGDAETRVRVAGVIRSLMQGVSPMTILHLDESSRSWRAYSGVDASGWHSITASAVRQLALVPDATPLLGVASFHVSGHIREAAVDRLDEQGDDEALPYLLVRLNDWVTPVATRARKAVERRIGTSAAAWVRCLPLVVRLQAATRREHGAIVEAVFASLRQPANRPALEIGFTTPDRGVRRLCYRLAREGAGDELASVIARAFRDREPVVRLDALRDAGGRLGDGPLAAILNAAERDGFVLVRRAALLLVEERFAHEVLHHAKRALLDRSPSVRELARFLVAKYDREFSVVERYREALRTARDAAPAALAGLAETGDASDASLVTPFLTDRRAPVRAQAIRTLSRLSAESAADALVRALSDPSPRVTHAARDALQQNPSLIDSAVVADAIRNAQHTHARLDALRVAEALGKWPSLILWLETAAGDDDALALEASERVRRWVHQADRRFAPPKPSEVSAIESLIAQSSTTMSEALRGEIRARLQPWFGNA